PERGSSAGPSGWALDGRRVLASRARGVPALKKASRRASLQRNSGERSMLRPLGPKRRLEEDELADGPAQGGRLAVGKDDWALGVSRQGDMRRIAPEFQGDARGDHAGAQERFEGVQAIALPADAHPEGLRALEIRKRAKRLEL